MKRPLVWAAVAMACGAYAGAWGWLPGFGLPVLLCVCGAAVLALVRSRRLAQPFATSLIFLGAGALLWSGHHRGAPGDALSRWSSGHRNAYVELIGTVEHPDLIVPGREYASFVLTVSQMRQGGKTYAVQGRTHLRWYAPSTPVWHGDTVRVRGELSNELGHVNPGVQDLESYFRIRHVYTSLSVRDARGVEVIAGGPWWSPSHWASRLRHAEAERLRPVVPASIYPFVLAVWLGDRREISEGQQHAYLVSGTVHILSVSGVHMSILYVSVAFFLKLLWPDRVRLRALLTLGAVFTFALLTGARVSSLRAASMIALYLLADVLDREPDAPTALGMAGILFTVLTPDALLDVGFLLSFSSVASLLLYREPIEAWISRVTSIDPMRRLVPARARWMDTVRDVFRGRTGIAAEVALVGRQVIWGMRSAVSTALAVQILPLPLAVHFFHVLPLAGPLFNLAVVPLVGVVLWLGLITTAAAFLAPPIAPLFGHAMAVPVWLVDGVTSVAERSGAYALIVSPSLLGFFLYWILACLVLLALRRRFRIPYRHWALGGCCVLCIVFWAPLRLPGEVVVLDVGHGDAIFIRAPGGATILVDAGDRNEYSDRGARVVAPFLWANHVRRLDYLIVTHADRDHMGGARYVIEHFRVGTVLLNSVPTDRSLETELLAACAEAGVPVRRLVPGDEIRAGEARFRVLHPPPRWPAEPVNDASLVMKLTWTGLDMLLAGDVEEAAERALLEEDVRSAVLKVPHHGSITSSSPAFLDAVQPGLAVISGSDRRARGMHEAVLRRYRDRGIRILRTDIDGGVTLRVEDGELVGFGERARRGYVTP